MTRIRESYRMCSLVSFFLAFACMVAPLAVAAQPLAKVARMGYLSVASPEGDKAWLEAFRQGLRDHGYVEGRNVVVEVRHAAQRLERLPGLAAELVGLKIDVAVVYGGPALLARQESARLPSHRDDRLRRSSRNGARREPVTPGGPVDRIDGQSCRYGSETPRAAEDRGSLGIPRGSAPSLLLLANHVIE